jgi:hypothetical protein
MDKSTNLVITKGTKNIANNRLLNDAVKLTNSIISEIESRTPITNVVESTSPESEPIQISYQSDENTKLLHEFKELRYKLIKFIKEQVVEYKVR